MAPEKSNPTAMTGLRKVSNPRGDAKPLSNSSYNQARL